MHIGNIPDYSELFNTDKPTGEQKERLDKQLRTMHGGRTIEEINEACKSDPSGYREAWDMMIFPFVVNGERINNANDLKRLFDEAKEKSMQSSYTGTLKKPEKSDAIPEWFEEWYKEYSENNNFFNKEQFIKTLKLNDNRQWHHYSTVERMPKMGFTPDEYIRICEALGYFVIPLHLGLNNSNNRSADDLIRIIKESGWDFSKKNIVGGNICNPFYRISEIDYNADEIIQLAKGDYRDWQVWVLSIEKKLFKDIPIPSRTPEEFQNKWPRWYVESIKK